MFSKFLEKILKETYPERNFQVEKIGKRSWVIDNSSLDSVVYSLEDTFSYDLVYYLNNCTGYTARYGFSPNIGPVAIIGIQNPNFKFSYFGDIWEYGKFSPSIENEFFEYSDEDAEKISNYTVFGVEGISELKEFWKFDKICHIYDTRYRVKRETKMKIANMEAMLDGKYSYHEAKKMINHLDFRLNGHTITFAKVDESYNVGIIGLGAYHRGFIKGFKDVWSYGSEEPAVQTIRFLSNEEAFFIKDFKVYFYDYLLPSRFEKKYPIALLDRTYDSRFDFYDTPDGKDYRLTERVELFK